MRDKPSKQASAPKNATSGATIEWITKKELAYKLGISPGLITRLVYSDGMPHLKICRAIRVNYDAVLAWFEYRGELRRS